ncbi:divalent-cation tolerance protein CutA [Methanoplanus sp. FWC-SCC4]|uniref:Divalent-cation tolerance protein CutA n=1 Tax=Methanochimaera problematica TaxID=2609417 RepID=A0AA97FD95_9EURY|nr:divalent-cation tolerance protein CutA [Methanoplanus sp. FWC-SCC4]WOF16098.1 divalent-cation tolerance protein CutA [Methanoplanus sp. FWC-SCC4]
MSGELKKVIVVLCTVSSEESKKICKDIIKSGYAACINKIPVGSYYLWDDKFCHDEEDLLIIKTIESQFDDLKEFIKARHSYALPEIISIPVENGSEDYLNWVRETVTSFKKSK